MSDRKYVVKRGDNLIKIAGKFHIDVEELGLRNGIKDISFIRLGQVLVISDDQENVHVVQSGERLSTIANSANVSLADILAVNPKIRNPDLIFLGQRIIIPSGAAPLPPEADLVTPGALAMANDASSEETLALTKQDIVNIKKTLQTEWVQFAGDEQAKGIVDTILNRLASDHWGSSIADVVNARNQFSDINGPVSRKAGRHTVDEINIGKVSARVRAFVDAYLAERGAGAPSRVDTHLNYANPHFSDAKNLAWIMALDGPVLGRGNAIHRHGTTPELQKFRPRPYHIGLPGSTEAATATVKVGPIDGNRIAAEHGVGVKDGTVKIASLHPAMEAVIAAVARAANDLGLPGRVITSGNDSKHGKNSLHYANRALDFRGRDLTIAQGNALDSAVSAIVGPKYDVIFELFPDHNNNHLHVEYDPR